MFVGSAGTPNVIALGMADVGVVVLFGFEGNTDVDVLVCECSTERDETAVPGVLNVIAGYGYSWGVGRWCR